MFYQYQDPEITQHNLNQLTPNQRPYSASSNSCSSSESEHSHVQALHHLQNLNPYCADVLQTQHFPICFNNSPAHSSTQPESYVHDFGSKSHLSHTQTSAGYTSVIVEPQQYQLANEFVH